MTKCLDCARQLQPGELVQPLFTGSTLCMTCVGHRARAAE